MAKVASQVITSIVARQKRENARYERELKDRLEEARDFLESVPTALLKLDPTIRKIVLFGSLASGRVRRIDFDIDLAVDGDRYLKIVDWSLRQAFPIDVVDLQGVDEGFAQEVAQNGRILYETKR